MLPPAPSPPEARAAGGRRGASRVRRARPAVGVGGRARGRKEGEEAERGSAQCQEYNSAPRGSGGRRAAAAPHACPARRPERPGGLGPGGGGCGAGGRPQRRGRRGGGRGEGRRLGGRCEGGERRKRAVRGAVTTPPRLAGTPPGASVEPGGSGDRLREGRRLCRRTDAARAGWERRARWAPEGRPRGAPRAAGGAASRAPGDGERVLAEVKWPGVPRGGREPAPGLAAATVGAWIAITVAGAPSGADSRRPLAPLPSASRGCTGSDPRREDLPCGLPGAGCSGERGRTPGCFDVGLLEAPSARAGGRAVRAAAGPLVSRALRGLANFPSPSRYCSGMLSPGRGGHRAPGGPEGGKRGDGLVRLLGGIFPPLGIAKLTFLPQSSWFYSLTVGQSIGEGGVRGREESLPLIFFSPFAEPLLRRNRALNCRGQPAMLLGEEGGISSE